VCWTRVFAGGRTQVTGQKKEAAAEAILIAEDIVCSWSVSASSLRTLFLTGEDTPVIICEDTSVLMYEDTPFYGRHAARPGKIEQALPDVVEPGLAEA
jgi:hypothetical protein